MHRNKIYYYSAKSTQKTKARFDHLLQPPTRKWNGPIIKEVDK